MLVVAASPASAAWLTEGHDAARTFATPEEGPATGDVALHVPVNGRFGIGLLIVRDGWVYAMVNRTEPLAPGAPAFQHPYVVRVSLADASVEELLDLGELSGGFADWTADDARIYYHPVGGVRTFRFPDLAPDWELRWPTPDPLARVNCIQPASAGGVLYFSCARTQGLPGDLFTATVAVLTFAVRAADGSILWEKEEPFADPDAAPTQPNQAVVVDPGLAGITYAADRVVYGTIYAGADGVRGLRLRARDPATGDLVWWRDPPTDAGRTVSTAGSESPRAEAIADPSLVSSDGRLAFAKLGAIQALDVETGAPQWAIELPDSITDYASVAVAGPFLYVAAGPRLAKILISDQSENWSYELSDGFEWSRHGLIATPSTLYALALEPDPVQRFVPDETRRRELYAFDIEDGDQQWRRPIDTREEFSPLSLAEGIIAYRTAEGNVTVLGRSGAAIQPVADLSSEYPEPRAEVVVDMAGSAPGAQAADLEFRAEWGDGSVSEWGSQARFAHVYEQQGDFTARFLARNSAGQTASETRVIHVGGSPPVEPNFIARAFTTENQDTTFFFLGLLVTALGALFAFLLRARRRSLLEREIHSAEAETDRLRGSPAECERMLDERRRRSREHFVRRRLDESQAAILDARIEELRRSVRLGAVEGVLGELPHNLVIALQQMLRDGRINAWERRHLSELLERSEVLSSDQKARVRALVDRWHAHDETTGPAP